MIVDNASNDGTTDRISECARWASLIVSSHPGFDGEFDLATVSVEPGTAHESVA